MGASKQGYSKNDSWQFHESFNVSDSNCIGLDAATNINFLGHINLCPKYKMLNYTLSDHYYK
jgi:hypothetical protein